MLPDSVCLNGWSSDWSTTTAWPAPPIWLRSQFLQDLLRQDEQKTWPSVAAPTRSAHATFKDD